MLLWDGSLCLGANDIATNCGVARSLALDSAGTLGAAIIFVVYLFANYFEKAAPEIYGVPAWQIALPIHIAAWILQVPMRS